MRPLAVRAAVVAAVVGGLIDIVAVAILLMDVGHRADVFVRNDPGSSRGLGLAVVYSVVGVVTVLACLKFLGAWKLRRGYRSGWVLLLVLAGLGALGAFTARSLMDGLELVPDLVLLACLLLPSTRAFVPKVPAVAQTAE
jgi:hypothetical protein